MYYRNSPSRANDIFFFHSGEWRITRKQLGTCGGKASGPECRSPPCVRTQLERNGRTRLVVDSLVKYTAPFFPLKSFRTEGAIRIYGFLSLAASCGRVEEWREGRKEATKAGCGN